MQVVQDSAEHHFLTLLEKIKQTPAGWVGIHCAFSRRIDHDSLIADLPALAGQLSKTRSESQAFMLEMIEKAGNFRDSVVYQFADSDLLLLARPANEQDHDQFYTLFKTLSAQMKPGLIDYINFGREMMGAQKLADKKLLAQKRMTAYDEMGDDELAEIESRASVAKALAQQARRRRLRAA